MFWRTRGRHRPTKTALSETYPLPLVETWETARTWGYQPPSTWQQLLTWVHRA